MLIASVVHKSNSGTFTYLLLPFPWEFCLELYLPVLLYQLDLWVWVENLCDLPHLKSTKQHTIQNNIQNKTKQHTIQKRHTIQNNIQHKTTYNTKNIQYKTKYNTKQHTIQKNIQYKASVFIHSLSNLQPIDSYINLCIRIILSNRGYFL